jgi:predicted Fe-Mo cluster-binding NifX family protein
LHTHFGSAPFFTIVDTESGSVAVVPNSDSGHGHGHGHGTCRGLKQAGLPRFDAIVCRTMGRRALATLMSDGLEVLVTRKKTVSEIVAAIQNGEATRLSSLEACEGHRHHHQGGAT